MTNPRYINVRIGENTYPVSAVDYPEGYDDIAMLGAIIVKLHQRVEELEWHIDDLRSIIGCGEE